MLKNNRAFNWNYNDGVQAKGYLFGEDGKLYEGNSLLDYFREIKSEKDFCQRVCRANGSFCVVVKFMKSYYIAVDRIRSIPIFIASCNGITIIGDDANCLRDALFLKENDLDKVKLEELYLSGYTVGNHTIYKNIVQLQGGEYAVIENDHLTISCYYKHNHGDFIKTNKEKAFSLLDDISRNVFKRLVETLHGRQMVIPLSGGYDSRYIVAWMKKLGYDNVCCFSYGRANSFEVSISRQVAYKLGYPWYFIEYTNEVWNSILTDEWWPFYEYSGQLCQCPHYQDIFAIKALLQQEIIQNDAVIVPGYCGDVLGGSFILEHINKVDVSRNGLAKYLYESHFNFIKSSKMSSLVLNDIKQGIESTINSLDEFNAAMECWLTTHRWSKFIVNALRGYDYFNLEWRMPLWDNELTEFWYRVPNEYRGSKTWYNEYLLTGIFKDYGIDFVKHNAMVKNDELFSLLRKIKHIINKTIDEKYVNELQRFLFGKKNDFNNYSAFINKILEDSRIYYKDKVINKQNPDAYMTLMYLQVILDIQSKE